jgi:hypothetical protein
MENNMLRAVIKIPENIVRAAVVVETHLCQEEASAAPAAAAAAAAVVQVVDATRSAGIDSAFSHLPKNRSLSLCSSAVANGIWLADLRVKFKLRWQ